MGGTYYGDENPPECVRNCDPQENGGLMPGLGIRVAAVFATLFGKPYTVASRTLGAVIAAGKTQDTGPSLGWRLVASAVQGRQFRPRTTKLGPEKQASGPRKYVYVPHAYTIKKSEIIENALAGLQQAHIDVEPKLRSVAARQVIRRFCGPTGAGPVLRTQLLSLDVQRCERTPIRRRASG
jgi:hypothetical protein